MRTRLRIAVTIPVRMLSVALQFLGHMGEILWEWQEGYWTTCEEEKSEER